MPNYQALPHSVSYSRIAQEHDNIDPTEVEAMSKFFGNDFESIDRALDYSEPEDNLKLLDY